MYKFCQKYKILSKKDRGAFRVLQAKILMCKRKFIITLPRVLEKIPEEIKPPILPPISVKNIRYIQTLTKKTHKKSSLPLPKMTRKTIENHISINFYLIPKLGVRPKRSVLVPYLLVKNVHAPHQLKKNISLKILPHQGWI